MQWQRRRSDIWAAVLAVFFDLCACSADFEALFHHDHAHQHRPPHHPQHPPTTRLVLSCIHGPFWCSWCDFHVSAPPGGRTLRHWTTFSSICRLSPRQHLALLSQTASRHHTRRPPASRLTSSLIGKFMRSTASHSPVMAASRRRDTVSSHCKFHLRFQCLETNPPPHNTSDSTS